jgi:HD-like signal output (HDOD) protein
MSEPCAVIPATPTAGDVSAEAMAFVKELAREVSDNRIELPSYPEAALRVQRTLSDPNADANGICQVIGAEPVLAARVISMANSAAMNQAGWQVTNLRAAVQRVGFDALRSACFSFAVGQLRNASAYRAIEKPMTRLWLRNIAAAAGAMVLARRCKRVVPDTAMLAGLMSGVGKLYILTRSQKYPALFGDPTGFEALLTGWHPGVARSILENWAMVDEVVDAVANYEDAHLDQRVKLTLADFVAVGDLLAQCGRSPVDLNKRLAADPAAQRLGVTRDNVAEIVADVDREVAAFQQMLSI